MTPLQWGRSVSGIDYGTRGMGVCADPGSYRWCQALSRSRSSFATNQTPTEATIELKSNSIQTTSTTNRVQPDKPLKTATESYRTDREKVTYEQEQCQYSERECCTCYSPYHKQTTTNAFSIQPHIEITSKIILLRNRLNFSQLLKSFQLFVWVFVILGNSAYANIPGKLPRML